MAYSTFGFNNLEPRPATMSHPLPDRSLTPFWQPPLARESPVNFVGLPVELKGLIYEYVLEPNTRLYVAGNDPASTHSGEKSSNIYGLPTICFTNKLERTIAIHTPTPRS